MLFLTYVDCTAIFKLKGNFTAGVGILAQSVNVKVNWTVVLDVLDGTMPYFGEATGKSLEKWGVMETVKWDTKISLLK